MKIRAIKLISCVVLITCLMVGICTTAFADPVGGAGLLGSALSSLGIDLLAGGSATVATLAPWLNNDFSIIGALTGVADGYIKVGDQSVTIDGVQYESIFLDPSMAMELHTQAFDFATQKAITSNSSGLLATGAGYASGIPIYYDGTYYLSQTYQIAVDGGTNYSQIGDGPNYLWLYTTYRPTVTNKYAFGASVGSAVGTSMTETDKDPFTGGAYLRNDQLRPASWRIYHLKNGVSGGYSNAGYNLTIVEDTFDYSYVSRTIDTDPLPLDYGFQLFVPTADLQQAGFTPGTLVIDGGTGTDAILDLIALIDQLYGEEKVIDAEFTDVIDPPAPPTPVPTDTPLSDVPYSQFVDTFGQSITDGLEDVNDTIGLYGEEIIDTVDTVGQSITDKLDNVGEVVDTVGQSIVDELENVETGIDTLGQTLTGALDDAIDNVLEAVDSIATTLEDVIEAIMTHPLDLFSNFLDRLANIPIIRSTFDSIKQHVGIWHYVVEWLTCVGGFLGFMIGVFSDTAYCMVVPIYACVAAAICLAFYKRFGR